MNFFQGDNQMKAAQVQEPVQRPEVVQADASCQEAENVVRSALQELGSTYFEAHKDDPEAEYSEMIAQIKKNMEMETLWRQYRLSLDEETQCVECGTIVTSDSLFCKKCGSKIPAWDFSSLGVKPPEAESAPAANVCHVCGRPLVPGAMFCEMCGTRVG